jgi:hypothetical protein
MLRISGTVTFALACVKAAVIIINIKEVHILYFRKKLAHIGNTVTAANSYLSKQSCLPR